MLPLLGNDLLGIYLNDHLAGSTAGLELARRGAEPGTRDAPGDFPGRLGRGDRGGPEGSSESWSGSGWPRTASRSPAAGRRKTGRLKLNGRITGYSPLSRLVEVEGLLIGVYGKRAAGCRCSR